MADHERFAVDNVAALCGGNALGAAAATSVRPDGADGFTVADAPFAETREVLSGYCLVEAADLDQALVIAGQVPVVSGGVEVRPVRSIG